MVSPPVRSTEHFGRGKIKRDRTSRSTFLPHMQNPFNCFSTILVYYNIKTIHLPTTKTCTILRMVKDRLGLGVYTILCECGDFYTWELDHTKKHQRDLQLYHPVHSAVAEHSTDQGYGYTLKIKLLHYTSIILQVTTEINLHGNFIRKGGYQLSPGW
jgi:hypothetical protein